MKLEILVGNIASGKSTYCKKAAQEGAIIINDDAIVNLLHNNNYKLYDKNLKPLYKGIENTAIVMAIALGRPVVIDRPNLSVKMRRRYIGLGHSLDVPVEMVIFQWAEPAEHAKRRMASDSRGHDYAYWLKVAEIFQDKYTEPNQDIEHFDSLCYWNHDKQAIQYES